MNYKTFVTVNVPMVSELRRRLFAEFGIDISQEDIWQSLLIAQLSNHLFGDLIAKAHQKKYQCSTHVQCKCKIV